MESQRGWPLAAPFYVAPLHFATLTCRNINIIHWMTFSRESHFRATASGNVWTLRCHRIHHYGLPNTHQDCRPFPNSRLEVIQSLISWHRNLPDVVAVTFGQRASKMISLCVSKALEWLAFSTSMSLFRILGVFRGRQWSFLDGEGQD